jgi:hypothetical protein
MVALGAAVFAVWRSNQDAITRLRDQIESLERELGSLRELGGRAPEGPRRSAGQRANPG